VVFWTENGIRNVVLNVLSGSEGTTCVRTHVANVLRGDVDETLVEERRRSAEQLAERAKTSLHRRLNEIYAAQCERLDAELAKFIGELEKKAPEQERRLKALEQKLNEVETACEHWLDTPRQQLKRVAEEHQAAVAVDLNNLSKGAATRTRAMVARGERKVAEMIEQKLHGLIVAAVREHVTSASFEEDSLSNKQIAAARGMSLRAVKRLRRAGLA
jgi:hypothetical protein